MSEDAELPPAAESPPETTTANGQRLVRAPRKKKREGALRSLDDVVKRHLPPEPAAPEPVYTLPDADVPPDDDDPRQRATPTISEIELTPAGRGEEEEVFEVEDTSDKKLRTLEDLNARFPFDGSGQYFVYVNRLQPKLHDGVACYGRQQNMVDPLSYDHFVETYGGGYYELIVYGPPEKGKMLDKHGNVVPKALTKPVKFMVPYIGAGGRDPNALSAFGEDDAERDEREHEGRGPFEKAINLPDALLRRRGNTPAESQMYARHLDHQEKMDERAREDRKEERERRESEERTALGAVTQTKDQVIEMLRDELREVKKSQQNGRHGSDMEGVAKVLEAVRGPQASSEELDRQRQMYEEQLRVLRETHAQRQQELEERYRREREEAIARVTRDKEDATRRAELEVERAHSMRTETERRLTYERDQEREKATREAERQETMHQRYVEGLQREHERDKQSVKDQYEARINSLQDRMDSEARLLTQVHESTKQVEKTMVESELRTAQREISRLESELLRVKTELDKKGNLPKLLEEQDKVAAALGYVKESEVSGGEGEADIKTIGLKALASLAQNLPEVIKQAGEAARAVQGARQGGGAPPGRGMFPPQNIPMAGPPPSLRAPVTHGPPVTGWLSEGLAAPPLPAVYQQPPAALIPAVAVAPPAMPAREAEVAPPPVPAPAMAGPMYPTSPSAAPMQPGPAPQPSAAPARAPAPAPASPAAPAVQVSDAEVLQFAPTLEGWLAESIRGGMGPAEKAREVLKEFPQLALIVPTLTAEFVVAALRRGGRGNSPLVRRDGQRFLTQFRDAMLAPGLA